jgi:hypothetical protein
MLNGEMDYKDGSQHVVLSNTNNMDAMIADMETQHFAGGCLALEGLCLLVVFLTVCIGLTALQVVIAKRLWGVVKEIEEVEDMTIVEEARVSDMEKEKAVLGKS